MNKPREFWIELGNECDDIVWHKPVNEKTIHVIEYSAYEDAKSATLRMEHAAQDAVKERDELSKEVIRHCVTIDKLKLNAPTMIRVPSASGRSDRIIDGIIVEQERDQLRADLKLAVEALNTIANDERFFRIDDCERVAAEALVKLKGTDAT